MKNDFALLEKEFLRIKNMGLIRPLRKGSTGLGYTFETLINKVEDQDCKPDFKSIEIKCKLGYSKTPISLFTCAPKRDDGTAINYIFEKYSYFRYNNPNDKKIFSIKIFTKYATNINGYEFKLKVDYLNTKIIMQSYYNNIYIEDVCYWDFKTIETKLKRKMSNLAIIYGYPYTYENILYYKYLKMEKYYLKGFFEFLKLIEEDKICIYFHLTEKYNNVEKLIDNHGVCFKIRKEYLDKLFYRIF